MKYEEAFVDELEKIASAYAPQELAKLRDIRRQQQRHGQRLGKYTAAGGALGALTGAGIGALTGTGMGLDQMLGRGVIGGVGGAFLGSGLGMGAGYLAGRKPMSQLEEERRAIHAGKPLFSRLRTARKIKSEQPAKVWW